MTAGTGPTPNGCAHCGIDQQQHMQRWVPTVGWHQWVEPPDRVRLQRMLARRKARIARQS